LSLVIMASIRL